MPVQGACGPDYILIKYVIIIFGLKKKEFKMNCKAHYKLIVSGDTQIFTNVDVFPPDGLSKQDLYKWVLADLRRYLSKDVQIEDLEITS